MYNFEDLVYRSTAFTLNALEQVNSKVIESLTTSASTIAVKNLQMIQLQKAILAVGMFSIFDSILQKELSCTNGFKEARKKLHDMDEDELLNQFNVFVCAINVLKHGRGRSYDALVVNSKSLPFRIKLPNGKIFSEGDVSEVNTLIEVDDKFVLNCAELIEQVSECVRNEH